MNTGFRTTNYLLSAWMQEISSFTEKHKSDDSAANTSPFKYTVTGHNWSGLSAWGWRELCGSIMGAGWLRAGQKALCRTQDDGSQGVVSGTL